MRWNPMPIPDAATGESVDFLDGLVTMCGHGDPMGKEGCAIHMYTCNASMGDKCFTNSDGDMLIVPQVRMKWRAHARIAKPTKSTCPKTRSALSTSRPSSARSCLRRTRSALFSAASVSTWASRMPLRPPRAAMCSSSTRAIYNCRTSDRSAPTASRTRATFFIHARRSRTATASTR
mmetsp:Transcript_34988/g.93671  ORF Transcript_34988/g.93671 Transcript_34988/m.93671 type:complete len:177 (-) Transcript_34988:1081-1611(-)